MKIIMIYYKKMISKYKKIFFLSFIIMIAVTTSNILIPCGMRFLVERISQKSSIGTRELKILIIGLAIFLCCMGINTLLEILWYLLLDRLGGLCIKDLMLQMEEALSKALLTEVDEIGAEMLKHTMYSDVLDVFRVLAHHIPSLISSIITTSVCMSLAFIFSGKFACYLLLSVGIGWYVSFLGKNRISQKAGKTNQKMKQCHAICNQYIESLNLVQTNNVLAYFQETTSDKVDDFIRTAKKEDKLILFWSKLSEHYNTITAIVMSILLLVPSWGGSVENLIFFTMLSTIINSHGQSVQELMRQIIRAQVSFENVDKVCRLRPRQKINRLCTVETIEFDKVDFSYQNGQYILKQISCKLNRGQIIRLVGENGSGKSTFIKLMLGLYKPNKGTIKINSKPIDNYCQKDIVKQFLYISQDEVFLNETLIEYLCIITQNESSSVLNLLRKYGMDPNRLIENEGKTLSAGQRKKLLIIKLLLRVEEASVLIVDEIEAGLDVEAKVEYEHMLNMLAAKKDKLIIVVEHASQDIIDFTKVIQFPSVLEKNDLIVK